MIRASHSVLYAAKWWLMLNPDERLPDGRLARDLVRRVATGPALRILGLREQLHPFDAVAWVYPDRAAAEWFAKENAARYGHPTFGPVNVEGGWLTVLDLRPALRRDPGVAPVDPAKPDDYVARIGDPLT